MARTKIKERDVLYYDGKCDLCRAEMKKLYRCREDILLLDIHHAEQSADIPDKNTLLRQLHLKKADGEWLKGLDANIRAWKNTRYFGLWRLLELPFVHWLASKIYHKWAIWRYRRLYKNAS